MRRLAWVLAPALLGAVPAAQAHELRPGYLQIRETAPDRFDVLWKIPARGDERLGISVRLPESCTSESPRSAFVDAAFLESWRATCPGGLTGRRVSIEGLAATRTDVVARFERRDGTTETHRLTAETPAFAVTASPSRLDLARAYALLGVEHILLGADHLLFVLGLLFLVGSWPRLVGTVTAFTVAHSLTLAAATLGLVRVPQAWVEATIALSVAFVAAEVLHAAKGRPGLAARAPWLVACAFGLLHGLGFAGALRDVGLPEREIPLALLLFNVGVEVGQLVFIAIVVVVLSVVARLVPRSEATNADVWHADPRIRTPVAYGVGSLAGFWVVERVAAFWP